MGLNQKVSQVSFEDDVRLDLGIASPGPGEIEDIPQEVLNIKPPDSDVSVPNLHFGHKTIAIKLTRPEGDAGVRRLTVIEETTEETSGGVPPLELDRQALSQLITSSSTEVHHGQGYVDATAHQGDFQLNQQLIVMAEAVSIASGQGEPGHSSPKSREIADAAAAEAAADAVDEEAAISAHADQPVVAESVADDFGPDETEFEETVIDETGTEETEDADDNQPARGTIWATPFPDMLDASGFDIPYDIYALESDDVVFGTRFDDLISGDAGADQLTAGAGDDTLHIDADDTLVDGGTGYDHAIVDGPDGVTLDMNAGSIERATGNVGADTFDATGMTVSTIQSGGAGNDTLTGGEVDDTIDGGDATDQIYGRAGDDTLDGGDGRDTIYGGDGHDTIYGGSVGDRLYGDAGDDMIYGEDNNDRLYGGDGNDTLDGGGHLDRLYGEAGDDTLIGGDGNDQLYGGDGDDTITGGEGFDTIDGGAGDDIIRGGTQPDTVTGGDGSDTFQYVFGEDDSTHQTGQNVTPDQFDGGQSVDWIDTIQLMGVSGGPGVGGDWTLSLSTGSIQAQNSDNVSLSNDSAGTINFSDGSELSFTNVESIVW